MNKELLLGHVESITRPNNRIIPCKISDYTDADLANYLADDIEINGIESATSCFDLWEPIIYVRALRLYAETLEARKGRTVF